jgi:hypothetical protein
MCIAPVGRALLPAAFDFACVGRTLLSDAFDLPLRSVLIYFRPQEGRVAVPPAFELPLKDRSLKNPTRMPPRFSTYVSFAELNGGVRASLEQFRTELALFNRTQVIYLCGVMNSVITDWQGHYRAEAHEELVRNSFAQPFAEKIVAACRNEKNPRGVYHRQQLLFVCKQALLVCSDTGGKNPMVAPYSGEMARVLLMANDLLPKGLTRERPGLMTPDAMVKVMSELIPVGEASGHFRAINKIVRSRLMLDRFLPGGSAAVRETFEKKIGVSLREYFALSFATLGRYFDLDLTKYQADPARFVLSEGWFKTTAVSQNVVATFLAEVSAPIDDFAKDLHEQRQPTCDFTCFRSKPILRDGQNYLLIDPLFLAEKAESGVFWSINNALPNAKRPHWHEDWGAAFEAYVNWLIAESADGALNRIFPNPIFSDNGGEVCDAFILCGDSLLFVESKGVTFTASAKYGIDPARIRTEIEEKLVQNKEGGRGIGQLAARITEVFNCNHPRNVKDLDISKVKKVFPVLITRDDIGAALLVNAYLASRFRDLFNRGSVSVTVTTPHCLSAQDLEMICGYLGELRFADLLDERYRNDRGLQSSFGVTDNEIMDRAGGRECKAFSEASRAYFREMAETLFPGGGTDQL